MQFFKGDSIDNKIYDAGKPAFQLVNLSKDAFFNNAFQAFPLGEVLWDTGASPIIGRVSREVFRESFKEIFDAFIVGGSLEAYLTVFRKVFGEQVDIEFVIPNPGHLQINISSDALSLSDWIGYEVVDNEFSFFEIIDHEGDNISFQSIPGITSQGEIELFLVEMIAAGVFIETTLTIGS